MTPAEQAVRAASRARDLCLSLRRAFVGPRAVAALRAGEVTRLTREELETGLGLAWAAGDVALVRSALAALPGGRIEEDPVLAAFHAAVRDVTTRERRA